MQFVNLPLHAWQFCMILLIFSLIFIIIDLLVVFKFYRKIALFVSSSILLIIEFLLIYFLTEESSAYKNNEIFNPLFNKIIQLPYWIILIFEIVFFSYSIFVLILCVLKKHTNISTSSIKESFDELPLGVTFYEKSGLVRLINTEMNNLVIKTIGTVMLNGNNFYSLIKEEKENENYSVIKEGENPIIKYNDGKIISFKRYEHILDNKIIYELVATDVTETYKLTSELDEKIAELKEINKRLIEYGENVEELSREKEVLVAKIRVHDNMGKLLLGTRRALNEEITENVKNELLSFWKIEIDSLKNQKTETRKSNLDVIEEAAKLVGVNIVFSGIKVDDRGQNGRILVNAMHECLTNTVSHANGKTMFVDISKKGEYYIIVNNNDGKKPTEDIVERGGLSSLRTLVEKTGGKMTIESKPTFKLILKLKESRKI